MKVYQFKSVLAMTAFVMLGTAAFATASRPSHKELKAACIAELQPPVAKGERLTPAQGDKVRACIAAKVTGHAKTEKPVAENTESDTAGAKTN